MSLTEILAHHTAAIGGRAVVESVQTLQVEFHLVEPNFAVNGRYLATRNGQMRVDIFAGDTRVFTEAYDGQQAWQLPQDAAHGAPVSLAGTRALLHGLDNQLYGLHEFATRGHRLALVGGENVDGRFHYIVKVAYADGHVVWRYVDGESWLVTHSRERKALHPDVDPVKTTVETRFSDFRPLDNGLVRPFHEVQVDLSTGETLQTTTVQTLLINPDVDTAVFVRP